MKTTPLMRTLNVVFFALLAMSASAQQRVKQEFHDNGMLRSTLILSGDDMRFVTYYETGRVKEIGAFHKGRRNGVWKQFGENGTVLARARFANGVRQGVWEFRTHDDQLMGRSVYANDALRSTESYGDQGTLVAVRAYP